MRVGIIQYTEGLNITKWQRKGEFAVSVELGHLSSFTLGHWALGSQVFGLGLELCHWLSWASSLLKVDRSFLC